jgi:hypothetical protein
VVVFQEDRRIMLHLCFGSLFESCGLFLYAWKNYNKDWLCAKLLQRPE